MNKEKYLELRNALIAEAESLVAEGKIEDANAKMEEVKKLDAKFEQVKLANANMNALKDVAVVTEIEDKSVTAKIIDNVDEGVKMDKITNGTEEYQNAWLSKMKGAEITDVQRTALENNAEAIPTQTLNKVIEKMEAIAPILGKIELSTIPSNLSIPVEKANADASWVAMGSASVDSADTLDAITLGAHKLIKTVEIGADVSKMAIPAFEDYLVRKLAKKMAKALENAVINGTGSGQPTGLLKASVITNTGTFTKAGMTYADLLTIIGDLPDHGYRAGASFVMPSALFYSDVLPALTDKGSGLDVQAVEKMKIFGYDVILSDRVPTDTIVFGNLENYAMNLASDVKVESDRSVGFRSGSTVYRAMALADGNVVNAAAFNAYTRASE